MIGVQNVAVPGPVLAVDPVWRLEEARLKVALICHSRMLHTVGLYLVRVDQPMPHNLHVALCDAQARYLGSVSGAAGSGSVTHVFIGPRKGDPVGL